MVELQFRKLLLLPCTRTKISKQVQNRYKWFNKENRVALTYNLFTECLLYKHTWGLHVHRPAIGDVFS